MPVRDATRADAAGCAALYARYVEGTAVSFETVAPSAEEVAGRIAAAQERHAWLVLERAGDLLGYAYAGPWRARAAYAWNAEVSVYVDPAVHGTGAGRELYDALLARLTALGYRQALAGMVLPNPASQALHTSLGFEPVGTFRAVGWKLGAWHDVHWVQKALGDGSDGPTAR